MAVRNIKRVAVSQDVEPEDFSEDTETVEAPAPKRFNRNTSSPIASGWGAPKAERRDTEKAPYLKVDRTKRIIKLLDEEPSVRFKSHYVKGTNKYYTCIEVFNSKGDPDNVDCPLCDAGNRPSQKFMMNVIELAADVTEYEVKTWTFGVEVASSLQEFAQERPTSPLNKTDLYFQVYQFKTDNGRTSNKVNPIRSQYLMSDYDIEPFSEEELAAFDKRYGENTVWITSTDKMIEAARSV